MGLLRTPAQHIVIGEVFINSDRNITIRIKKPQADAYDVITLDQLLTEMCAPLQERASSFLQSPALHIKIGEVLRTGENTPALRIKKPRKAVFEVITIDELLVAIYRLVGYVAQ